MARKSQVYDTCIYDLMDPKPIVELYTTVSVEIVIVIVELYTTISVETPTERPIY